jgi:hypothetical protein
VFARLVVAYLALQAIAPACSSDQPLTCKGSPPEFCAVAELLSNRQGIAIGAATTRDIRRPTGNLVHFQLFEMPSQAGAVHSVEMHSDGCIYVAYVSPSWPRWYDSSVANDASSSQGVIIPQAVAPGRTPKTFRQLKDSNVEVAGWVSPGDAMPVGRRPIPKWFKLCVPVGAPPNQWTNAQKSAIPASNVFLFLLDSGLWCEWGTSFVTGPAQWSTILPVDTDHFNGQRTYFPDRSVSAIVDGIQNHYVTWDELFHLVESDPDRAKDIIRFRGQPNEDNYESWRVPWITSKVEGVVTNSFLSGGDPGTDHRPVEEGYGAGYPPAAINPFPTGPRVITYPTLWDCGGPTSDVENNPCDDRVVFVRPDPEYQFMLAWQAQHFPGQDCHTRGYLPCDEKIGLGNFDSEHQGNLENEIEDWLVPLAYRPQPGDRIAMWGRWAVDCGHDDWHAEVHPYEAYVSAHQEFNTAASRWEAVSSVVVTGDWTGATLDLDVWAPPRPSPSMWLHYSVEQAVRQGILVQAVPRPLENANHVHLTVAPAVPDNSGYLATGSRNDVYPDTPNRDKTNSLAELRVRRLAYRFRLWWSSIPPVGQLIAPDGIA